MTHMLRLPGLQIYDQPVNSHNLLLPLTYFARDLVAFIDSLLPGVLACQMSTRSGP